MHSKAVHALLLGLVAVMICGAQTRATVDKIVFPGEEPKSNSSVSSIGTRSSSDSDIDSTGNESSSISESNKISSGISSSSKNSSSNSSTRNTVEQPMGSDRIVFPEDKDESRPDYYNMIGNTTEPTANSTSLPDFGNHTTSDQLQPTKENGSTTELPTVDNRILVETLPVCPSGSTLRAGHCRKPA